MSPSFLDQVRSSAPAYLREHPNFTAWLNRQVAMAFATMMWAAESLGYNTAPMEGFDAQKISSALKLPLSYVPVALLAVGRMRGEAKFNGGRFAPDRTVFYEEWSKPTR